MSGGIYFVTETNSLSGRFCRNYYQRGTDRRLACVDYYPRLGWHGFLFEPANVRVAVVGRQTFGSAARSIGWHLREFA